MSYSRTHLSEYQNSVDILRQRAKRLNLTDNQINELFENTFKLCESQEKNCSDGSNLKKYSKLVFKLFLVLISLVLIGYILLNVHQPTSSIVLRNVQGLIYPGLKILRLLTIPIIKKFPSLTGETNDMKDVK